MNFKKLILIGGIVLVVIGCVMVAGCISTPTSQGSSGNTDGSSVDKLVGLWSYSYTSDGKTYPAFERVSVDGEGVSKAYSDKYYSNTKRLSFFTWKKTSDSSYKFTENNGGSVITVNYNSKTDTYTDSKTNAVHTRMDPIVGYWTANGKDKKGKSIEITYRIQPDGIVFWNERYQSGSNPQGSAKWKKISDGTYTVKRDGSSDEKMTLDSSKQKMTSSFGYVFSIDTGITF